MVPRQPRAFFRHVLTWVPADFAALAGGRGGGGGRGPAATQGCRPPSTNWGHYHRHRHHYHQHIPENRRKKSRRGGGGGGRGNGRLGHEPVLLIPRRRQRSCRLASLRPSTCCFEPVFEGLRTSVAEAIAGALAASRAANPGREELELGGLGGGGRLPSSRGGSVLPGRGRVSSYESLPRAGPPVSLMNLPRRRFPVEKPPADGEKQLGRLKQREERRRWRVSYAAAHGGRAAVVAGAGMGVATCSLAAAAAWRRRRWKRLPPPLRRGGHVRSRSSSGGGAWQAHRAIDTARGSRAPAADPRRSALGRPAPGLRFVRLGRDAGLRGRRGDRRGRHCGRRCRCKSPPDSAAAVAACR